MFSIIYRLRTSDARNGVTFIIHVEYFIWSLWWMFEMVIYHTSLSRGIKMLFYLCLFFKYPLRNPFSLWFWLFSRSDIVTEEILLSLIYRLSWKSKVRCWSGPLCVHCCGQTSWLSFVMKQKLSYCVFPMFDTTMSLHTIILCVINKQYSFLFFLGWVH